MTLDIKTELQKANDAMDNLLAMLLEMRQRFYWDYERENEINEVLYEEYKLLTDICDNHLQPVTEITYNLLSQIQKEEA